MHIHLPPLVFSVPLLLVFLAVTPLSHSYSQPQDRFYGSPDPDPVPHSIRVFWMRRAIAALPSPCPFAAFGAAIVNHTATHAADAGLGELVCVGANSVMEQGNPTLHGTSGFICQSYPAPKCMNYPKTLGLWLCDAKSFSYSILRYRFSTPARWGH